MSHLLTLNQVNVSYGPVQALYDVSLEVGSGEIVTLIGANGAGKSTLITSLFNKPKTNGGAIHFDGHNLTSEQTHNIAKLGLALVPEGRHVFPSMLVEENLVMGTIPIGENHLEQDRAHIFDIFPRLKERRNQRAGTLSGGEQQMLAIARGLMSRPKLLLLDEPSLGLAPIIVQQIFGILKEIAEDGMTVFLVEQNANHALKLAQRGYVLVNGRITLTGSGEELLANPQIREAYLGGH